MGEESLDDGVGHLLPAPAAVRASFAVLHGEDAVEEQHALCDPDAQVPVRRPREPEVRLVLREQVAQARWQWAHVPFDGEGEADGVSRRRVRILPDDEHAHRCERHGERREDPVPCRREGASGGLLGTESLTERGDGARDGREDVRPAGAEGELRR